MKKFKNLSSLTLRFEVDGEEKTVNPGSTVSIKETNSYIDDLIELGHLVPVEEAKPVK